MKIIFEKQEKFDDKDIWKAIQELFRRVGKIEQKGKETLYKEVIEIKKSSPLN